MAGSEIEGIHFIHIPKCGGTYALNHFRPLAAHMGIEWCYHSHRYFHQGAYAAPQGYLSIATVRNPFDLLVSVWCWDHQINKTGVGYGNVRKHFKDFKEFVTYFCLMSDFAFAPRGDWFYSIEPFHFSCDLNGNPRNEDTGLSTLSPIELCLMSRPKQWWAENLKDLFGLSDSARASFSFISPDTDEVKDYRPRFFDDASATHPAWFTHPQGYEQLESNYSWAYHFGKSGLDFRLLHDGWYYTSFLWYSLFDWITGDLIPDIIIPIEQFDDAMEILKSSMNVSDISLGPMERNAGVTRAGKDYRSYYDDKLIEMVSNILRPELSLFGYGFDEFNPTTEGIIQKEYFDPSPRPWVSLQSTLGSKKFKFKESQC